MKRTFSWGGLVNCFLHSEHVLILRSFLVASTWRGSFLCFSSASKLLQANAKVLTQRENRQG